MTRPAPPPSAQAGPFGGYLSKSTGKGINELFEQDLADDWTGGAEAAERIGPLLFSLTVYTAVRFAFLRSFQRRQHVRLPPKDHVVGRDAAHVREAVAVPNGIIAIGVATSGRS